MNPPFSLWNYAISVAKDIDYAIMFALLYNIMERYGIKRYTPTGYEINKWLCALYVYGHEAELNKRGVPTSKNTLRHSADDLNMLKQRFRDSLIDQSKGDVGYLCCKYQ